MKAWKRFFARLANFLWRRTDDQRLREEIAEHIALQTAENVRGGLPPAEARRQALLKFGAVEAVKEQYRAERGFEWLETFGKDLRYALRLLRKSPAFALVAVVTLALAIGANAVVFSILNAFLLRPLKIPQADRLYQLERASDKAGNQSYPNYVDLRDRNRSFDGLAAFNATPVGLDAGDNPNLAWAAEVSGNYFDALGLQPYLGRFFHASDEHGANSVPYIVLSYAFWHGQFHEDHGVLGRTVELNKHPFSIIGIAPPEFNGTLLFFHPDFFAPLVDVEQLEGHNLLNDRGLRFVFSVIGRLKPAVSPAQAIADLNSIGADLQKTYPKEVGKMTFTLARPSLYGDYLGPPVRAFLTGLMLLAGLILLAACTNLGSLFAARAADRSREVALRLALGASRLRILRQLFTEAVLISLAGGAAGLLGGMALLRWLSAWNPLPQWPVYLPVNPDANVLGVALLLAVASGFLFGAVPVRQVLHTDPYQIVKSGSIGAAGRSFNARDLLLGLQIAICAVLVTSSLVAVRGLIRTLHSNFGFEPRDRMLTSVDLNMAGYRGDAVPVMQKRMIDALGTMTGVTAVGLIDTPPLYGDWSTVNIFSDEAADLRPANAMAASLIYAISPEYLTAAGTTLLSGRAFTWHDDQNAPRVALVNLQFVNKVFGSAAATHALGRYFKLRDGTRVQIVGLVEMGKYKNLAEDPQPAMFLPMLQSPSNAVFLVLRSSRNPQQLAADMRGAFRALDSGLPVYIQTWDEGLRNATFSARMATVSLGVLGAMGAMLSVTGIFGLAAYSVSKRRKELGIRVALGAQPKEVLEAALGRAVKLLAVGSAAGLVLGILASRVLAYIVSSATPRDPLVLTGVVFSMALLGLLATWIPAQRALRVDPVTLLREE